MIAGAQMLTAQRLGDGAALYFTENGEWSPVFAEGAIFPSAGEAEAALASAQAFVAARTIVGPYLIAVAAEPAGAAKPVGARETIRAAGTVTFAIDHGSWRAGASG